MALEMRFAGLSLQGKRGRPRLMGIVNVTPDSFSDGGAFFDPAKAIAHGLQLLEDGADILDIGGESTRPGARPVSQQEELDRVLPVIEGLTKEGAPCLSIDTRNSVVMRAAIGSGAHIINDVSALTHDPQSLGVVAKLNVPVVLMHAKGTPQNMQNNPIYDDVVGEVKTYLIQRAEAAEVAGVARSNIAIDPGIGFGKTLQHNLMLLNAMDMFTVLPWPVLLGASRKRFIAALDDAAPVDARLGGSLGAMASAYQKGCRLFRVHDVAESRQHLKILHAIETVTRQNESRRGFANGP